jgi:hypothetical protein
LDIHTEKGYLYRKRTLIHIPNMSKIFEIVKKLLYKSKTMKVIEKIQRLKSLHNLKLVKFSLNKI